MEWIVIGLLILWILSLIGQIRRNNAAFSRWINDHEKRIARLERSRN